MPHRGNEGQKDLGRKIQMAKWEREITALKIVRFAETHSIVRAARKMTQAMGDSFPGLTRFPVSRIGGERTTQCNRCSANRAYINAASVRVCTSSFMKMRSK